MKERLQKVMAHGGVASRRQSEQLILAGKVKVNGHVVTELGTKVDPKTDHITVDGKPLQGKEQHVYYILNKPRGYITTAADERGRKTVIQLLNGVSERVYPVGRLDYDSDGLLLLTNDGELTQRVIHPSYHMRKVYVVKVKGVITDETVQQLREGVELEDGMTNSAYVEVLLREKKASLLRIGIHEGRNRQIRRMCNAVGHEVIRLTRTQVGPITLGKLETGQFRALTHQELGKLHQAVRKN